MAAGCAALAERVLASTVRLEFYGPAGATGHGTVVGGRYILTHNHYPVPGDVLSRGGEDLVTAISIFRANGDMVLFRVPLACFTVSTVDEEILVLDFQAHGGVGFFDRAGVPSAETLSLDALALQPGSEVAQIDWDGSTTHVDWAHVVAVHDDDKLPYVELDSFVQHGASGGGVFFNGRHIGNNWMRCTIQFRSGEVTRRYSVAALNR
jgi:hypothetical protein